MAPAETTNVTALPCDEASRILDGRSGSADIKPMALYGVFVLSGIAALLYQMIWQRALLTIYGTNIESVTVVVTAFMLGLGFGSLFGGVVSKNPRRPLLLIFSIVEFGIGAYGAISLKLFDWVGATTAGSAPLQTGLLSISLVLLPTLLMGSTLPLLVAHQVNATRHVGRSVGLLYFVNTLGAALGAFLATFFVLRIFGLTGSVWLAVGLNFTVATVVLVFWIRARGALS